MCTQVECDTHIYLHIMTTDKVADNDGVEDYGQLLVERSWRHVH